jgi:hypothetical protein
MYMMCLGDMISNKISDSSVQSAPEEWLLNEKGQDTAATKKNRENDRYKIDLPYTLNITMHYQSGCIMCDSLTRRRRRRGPFNLHATRTTTRARAKDRRHSIKRHSKTNLAAGGGATRVHLLVDALEDRHDNKR